MAGSADDEDLYCPSFQLASAFATLSLVGADLFVFLRLKIELPLSSNGYTVLFSPLTPWVFQVFKAQVGTRCALTLTHLT